MNKDEALKLALEALESGEKMQSGRLVWIEYDTSLVKEAITAIKAALEAKDEKANDELRRLHDLLGKANALARIRANKIDELEQRLTKTEAPAQPKHWEKFCDSNCVWTDHHPDCKLAKDEPVGYFSVNDYGNWEENESNNGIPLYTTPPQRKPLTDEQVDAIWPLHTFIQAPDRQWLAFARAIEAAHGIKGEA